MGKKKELNLGDVIYSKLREFITFGELSPGEKITESRIMKEFSASRTPFREAVKRLEAKGYVKTIHNKGTYVKKISMQDLEQIYDVLSVLEGYAVYQTAKNITEQQINKLEELNNDLKDLNDANNYKIYIEKNIEFHFLFPQLSGNDFLKGLIQELRDRVYRYRFAGITIPGHIRDYLLDHKAIIEAIKQRDPEQAEEKMRRHVQRVKHILTNFLREFPT